MLSDMLCGHPEKKRRRILLQSSEIKHSCVFLPTLLPTLFRKWESFQSCFINLGLTFKGYLNLLKERTEGRVSAGSTLHSLSDAAHAFDPVSLLLGNFPFSFLLRGCTVAELELESKCSYMLRKSVIFRRMLPIA